MSCCGAFRRRDRGPSADVQTEQSLHENLFIRYRTVHQCLGTGLEIAGGRGAADAPVDTGHCSLPNINSVYGNRILLFNRTIEVRAGAISHCDASAGGRRERWRTTADAIASARTASRSPRPRRAA